MFPQLSALNITPTHYINIYHHLRSGRIWHKVNFFKRSLTGLNSEFSFSSTSYLTKTEVPSLSYYLPIAGRRIIGFIPFPRILVRCEMQSVSSRIWTRVAVSISYDDNHYTTGTSSLSLFFFFFFYIFEKHLLTKLKGFIYFYLIRIILFLLFTTNYLFVHCICFQILLCITNNTIEFINRKRRRHTTDKGMDGYR